MRTDRSIPFAVAVAALISFGACTGEQAPSSAGPITQPARSGANNDAPPAPPSPPQIIGANQLPTAGEQRREPPQPTQRLVFQCKHDAAFAVRMTGGLLYVFTPSLRGGSLPLTRQPAESGLFYAVDGAEFRSDGELATLRLGDEHYVDCVANPAAAVWDTEPPRNLLE